MERLPFGNAISSGDLAELIFSLVIGMETRAQIEAQPGLSDRLFTTARVAARLIQPMSATNDLGDD